MEKEFNLSEQSIIRENTRLYKERSVKEFIKRLKEEIPNAQAHFIIDKLAGKDLVEKENEK